MMTRAKFWDMTVLNAICSGVLLMLGGCGDSSAEGRSEPLAKAAIAGELPQSEAAALAFLQWRAWQGLVCQIEGQAWRSA
jgi:hypothetical protein